MLKRVTAIAGTVSVEPGSEQADAQGMHVRQRVFTDRVQSSDAAFDGTNRVTIDADVDANGGGTLRGTFELSLSKGGGAWTGGVEGRFEQGMVIAEGVARGSGSNDGAVLYISYRQVKDAPAALKVEKPLAVFEMKGLIMPRK